MNDTLQMWAHFIWRRLLALIVLLAALVAVTFFMVRLIPGDPAIRQAGTSADAAYIEQLREQMGLNESVPRQFVTYAGGLLRGDLGKSLVTGAPVSETLGKRLPYTIKLAGYALLFVIVFGYLLGMFAAIFTRNGRNGWFEHGFTAVTGLLGAVPELVAGIVLAFIFAVSLRWLPVSGANTPASIVLPALAIGIRPAINLARIVRVEAGNALRSDYMRTAQSKRLPPRLLYVRHLAPNVATSALTIGGLLAPLLIGGAVVVENVFAWPGIGTTVVQGVKTADFPVIQGCVLLLGLIVILMNLVVDILLTIFDPRSLVAQ
ncbi:ABC transporter permease [Sinisalibacter aestuarii]|uniref:Peptide ABC transporter permease n=1 Tax=Sinisalibacter aestuarii TaxID=2949426 RepID=A0ABQ5LZW6_9RHOB|nr:ABC transporter permease [Sinisalibacter aestuarii]GKY89891.1 peptide ABC transporter permease [Sinisalibacter aestuarii]